MSDQTQPIFDENGNLSANVENKSKNNVGKVIAGGVAAGAAAISYDAYASSETTTNKPDSEAQAPDSLATETKDSTEVIETKDSLNVLSQLVPDSVSPTNPAGVTVIPDHMNVGNAPDNVSFAEAFQMSRENLGPAAVFEWRGELYHTCHPAEYAALSQDIKEKFNELWLENAILEPDWMPSEGNMAQIVVPDPETQSLPADTTTQNVDPKVELVLNELFESTDSLEVNTVTDIVYTTDDFDSDFEGKDEWINPEDIIS